MVSQTIVKHRRTPPNKHKPFTRNRDLQNVGSESTLKKKLKSRIPKFTKNSQKMKKRNPSRNGSINLRQSPSPKKISPLTKVNSKIPMNTADLMVKKYSQSLKKTKNGFHKGARRIAKSFPYRIVPKRGDQKAELPAINHTINLETNHSPNVERLVETQPNKRLPPKFRTIPKPVTKPSLKSKKCCPKITTESFFTNPSSGGMLPNIFNKDSIEPDN